MEKYMLYYALGAMAIYFVFWKLIPFFKKAKKVTKGVFSRVYLNKNSTITEDQYRKIAIGALYSEQQIAYINSLTTGLGKSDIRKLLSEWWGIDTPAEAKESLDYLQNKGFRFYFDAVLNAYQVTDKGDQKEILINAFDENDEKYKEDVQKAYDQLSCLKGTWKSLTENGIVSSIGELVRYNNVGWDCGRLVFLSRLCFDAGYISEGEAWEYIDKAYDLAISKFDTWEDFSKSYIIGRGMWGGPNCANEGIMTIAEELLTDERSPWAQLSFK